MHFFKKHQLKEKHYYMSKIQKKLLLKSLCNDGDCYQRFNKDGKDFNHLNFEARNIAKGNEWKGDTQNHEYLFVLLGGNFKAITSKGEWSTTNGRKNVFNGLAHALYLPPFTTFSIKATSEFLDLACGWTIAEEIHPAQFITPEDVKNMGIEFRGGDNASRQINSILPPGSNCHRLVCVEVYTPSGNWSSYPPHKHDEVKIDKNTGELIEANLEEIYFYKTEKAQGFAIQRVYTANQDLDELLYVKNNEIVLVPKGYHPVIAGHGYNIYYLNFLAGSHQSLNNTDDPNHKWIYGTWKDIDSRLPLVTIDMNKND